MLSTDAIYAVAYEDTGVSIMARIVGNAASNITQSALSTITLNVYEHDSRADAEAATNGTLVDDFPKSLTISDVVFDALQTDSRWTFDGTGYNFRYDSGASDRPTGRKWYRYEFKFTPVSGSPFVLVAVVATLALASS